MITASGADADNYSFAYVNGNLAITKALVTVTADDKTRIYGASDPAFTLSYSGFTNNEGVGVLSSGATAGSAALVTDHVGNYAITAGGANAANYNFAYVNGTLAITKATLTATASSGTREYGAGNPAFTVSYSGFVNGDDETHINTFATATSANAFANVGTHAVTAAGAFDNDYLFNYVLKATQMNGQRAIQVTSYVGVIRAPCGYQIEVLPKTGRDTSPDQARALLIEMLKCLAGFRHIKTANADLVAERMPLLEVFIQQFLMAVGSLVKRGLRSDYVARQDNLFALRGRLLVARQISQNLVRRDRFFTEHDEFSQDRAETD